MLVERCTLAHLFRHLGAKDCPLPEPEYRLLVVEVLDGRVMSGTNRAGVVAALGGVFVPDNGGPGTCWFSVVPGALSRDLVPAVLVIRDLLRCVGLRIPEGIAAYVRDGNSDGERLARALDFEPQIVMVDGLRQWIWGGNVGHADRTDGAKAVRAGAGGASAGGGRAGGSGGADR